MEPADEELRQEVADLKQRVARLEAVLAQPAVGAVWQPAEESAAGIEAGPEAGPEAGRESLEARLGSRIFNRIGIVAVLIGVAWFLKIAFDNRWLGAAGKVTAGVVAGLALFAWSERFRRHGYDAFSYSLKAVGAGLLYLSLWAAWSLFQLIGLPVAGAAMVLVTGGIGLLAWRRESELLAFYAAVGGYLTPLLLANGQNHEFALFAYLLVLDLAALALIGMRPWPRLALGAFLASAGYGMGWAAFYYTDAQFGRTLAFGIAFLLLFLAVPFVGRRDEAAPHGRGILVSVAILNAVVAFLGVVTLFEVGTRGWAALALCLLYFGVARAGWPKSGRMEGGGTETGRMGAVHLLTATCFALATVGFAIHAYWAGSGVPRVERAVDEQISYSAWFMAFGAMALAAGFWRRSAALRWQGLIVLCLSIAKVFVVDMRTLSQGYRVLSFLGLGALLLGVSFVYQKDWLSLRGGGTGSA